MSINISLISIKNVPCIINIPQCLYVALYLYCTWVMDEATLALLKPDESLGQYLSRIKKDKIESGVPVLDRCTAFHRSDVVELSGVVGSGKTEFLYSVRPPCRGYFAEEDACCLSFVL